MGDSLDRMAAFMKMREEIKEKLGTDFAMWINLARISILVWHGRSIHSRRPEC